MNSQKQAKEVGIAATVMRRYEQLKDDAEFWASLPFGAWLSIYFYDGTPEELKQRCFAVVTQRAKTFSDFEKIRDFCPHKDTALRDWALLQIKNIFIRRRKPRVIRKNRFKKVLESTETISDLVRFSNRVYCACSESKSLIDTAIDKMLYVVDGDCSKWVSAYLEARPHRVKHFILSKIKEFDLPTTTWLSFISNDSGLNQVIFEKAMASVECFEDCMAIFEKYDYGNYPREIVEKAIYFAEIFHQWAWIAKKHFDIPLALLRMSELAKTSQQWELLRAETKSGSFLHVMACQKIKELATA
jgi:hypothetical protein